MNFYRVGSQGQFREDFIRRKWLFFGFWDFRPFFKRLWHPSKWSLCLQKCWILFIYYVMSLQHNLHAQGKSPKRKTKGGGWFQHPPSPEWVENSPVLTGLIQQHDQGWRQLLFSIIVYSFNEGMKETKLFPLNSFFIFNQTMLFHSWFISSNLHTTTKSQL